MTLDPHILEAIIYDCDGVLVDSAAANRAFYDHILARFGLCPLTPEQWALVQPLTAPAAIDFLFHGKPQREAAQEYQKNVDNRPFLPLLRAEPRLTEALAALRRRYRTAIATNRGKSLPLVLKTLGLADLFDFTVSSLEVSRPKPHPECLEKVLAHFRISPRQACYIGDNGVDGVTAANAGMAFGAYRNPNLAADFHLEDHQGLLTILGLEP